MKLLSLLLLFLILCGCATPQAEMNKPQAEMNKNNANLLKLEIGMTKDEVLAVMGTPRLNEAYQSLNGRSVVIYFYYTQRQRADDNYTKDEMTPVVIESGKLVGWGDEFYKNKVEIDVNIKNE